MTTLSTVRTRRHRLLVGGQWVDPASGDTAVLNSPATGEAVAERLQTGQVTVNDTSNYWELHLPFGGWAGKASGHGRVGGRHIFDAMTQIRSVAFDVGRGTG